MDDAQRTSTGRKILTAIVLFIAVAASIFHQLGPTFRWGPNVLPDINYRLWDWYIEDAAISFAYSRNWAFGDGLVVHPAGERIEAYSNPLWVALIAIGYLFGVDGFVSSKYLGFALGGFTVVMSYFIAKELIDDKKSYVPLLAPLLLAAYPQFAIWNTSGLENSLFSFMLAGGIWRTLVEARKGGIPWSSLFYLGLAVTRPEAIMYAAWGGFLGMLAQIRRVGFKQGLKHTALWLAMFFIPFIIYHTIRYNYFAWMFPNTYYAKLGDKAFKPLAWTSRGWKYLRKFGAFQNTVSDIGTGTGWFVPIYLIGLIGLRKWRSLLIIPLSALLFVAFVYPVSDFTKSLDWWPKGAETPYAPQNWSEMRVWLIFGICLLVPWIDLKSRKPLGQFLIWGSLMITLFFSIRAGGDWMKGYRWLSFIAVPSVAAFVMGADEIGRVAQRFTDWLRTRLGRPRNSGGFALVTTLMAVAVCGVVLPGWFDHSKWFFGKRETGPYLVKYRVDYMQDIADKLFIEGPIYNLDVDMGAHLYWSEHHMLDMAGLVDVSVAHHSYKQRPFVQDYLFDTNTVHFAHVHGGWANSTRIPTYNDWKTGFMEVPPYLYNKRGRHPGNHIRRDLLMKRNHSTPQLEVAYNRGVHLKGARIPANLVSQGKSFLIEVAVRIDRPKEHKSLRMVGFVANAEGVAHSFEVPLAFDWLTMDEWMPGETFVGKFTPILPKGIKPGKYDIGFVFLDDNGEILSPKVDSLSKSTAVIIGGQQGVPAYYAQGEARYAEMLTVGRSGAGEREAGRKLDRAISLAESGQCVPAQQTWVIAKYHTPRAVVFRDTSEDKLRDPIAKCFADKAMNATEISDIRSAMVLARHWNHRLPEVIAAQKELGDSLFDKGMAAREEEDWNTAWEYFDAAVKVNPHLSWARRYAEEARDGRLNLEPFDPDAITKRPTAVPSPNTRPRPSRPLQKKPTPASPPSNQQVTPRKPQPDEAP